MNCYMLPYSITVAFVLCWQKKKADRTLTVCGDKVMSEQLAASALGLGNMNVYKDKIIELMIL